jgi:hypothetical protein
MKSPFPGMDPYLEARWPDVHSALIHLLKEALQPKLPTDLRARSEERLLLETISHVARNRYQSDVALLQTRRRSEGPPPSGALATVDPFSVEFSEAPEIDRFLQIIDVTNKNRVITAIEILSPWNKAAGRLNRDYRRKLNDYGRAEVSVVEIDLLRSSRRHLKVNEENVPPERSSPYLAGLRRSWLPTLWQVYPITLRSPLPAIPIPLRENEPEVWVALQPLIERVYVSGGHDDIDYGKPAKPPLKGKDAKWADELLKSKGKR